MDLLSLFDDPVVLIIQIYYGGKKTHKEIRRIGGICLTFKANGVTPTKGECWGRQVNFNNLKRQFCKVDAKSAYDWGNQLWDVVIKTIPTVAINKKKENFLMLVLKTLYLIIKRMFTCPWTICNKTRPCSFILIEIY